MWLGLRNSDDQGTQFDLKAELTADPSTGTTVVYSGELLCITGVTRNPSKAQEVMVSLDTVEAPPCSGRRLTSSGHQPRPHAHHLREDRERVCRSCFGDPACDCTTPPPNGIRPSTSMPLQGASSLRLREPDQPRAGARELGESAPEIPESGRSARKPGRRRSQQGRSRAGGSGETRTEAVLLSACLIVKNEARFLDGCLASIQDLVDEVVVVDTGVDRSHEADRATVGRAAPRLRVGRRLRGSPKSRA